MEVTIRKEVTIEVRGDVELAEEEAQRYERMGYIRFESNDEWIQLDKRLEQ